MATPHRLRPHVGVFRSVPAYMHEAMVAAYVRDATFAPMDDETLAPYVAPWLGAEGQEAFYRQIAQNDPRYTDKVQPLYGGIKTARADPAGRGGPEDTPGAGLTAARGHTRFAPGDDTPLLAPSLGGRHRRRGGALQGLLRPVERPRGAYSPTFGEGVFSEVRLNGVLRSSLPASNAKQHQR